MLSFLNNNKWKVLIIIALFLLIVFLIFHNTFTPLFFSLAEAEAVRIANQAINEAVEQEAERINYEDLMRYVLNDQGDIILMQPNMRYINSFSSRISLEIQKKLTKITKMTVPIPLSSIFGIQLLAGFGPDFHARIVPVGFTRPPALKDSLLSAGINQTRHKIYLEVTVQLKLIVPFSRRVVEVKADVPVTEVTILGRVPNVYIGLESDGISGILNGSK